MADRRKRCPKCKRLFRPGASGLLPHHICRWDSAPVRLPRMKRRTPGMTDNERIEGAAGA